MFSEDLKEGTSAAHINLEKKLVGRIKKIKTVEDYIQLLACMYGFYQPLQKRISNYVDEDISSLRGRQSSNILQDIKHLRPSHDLQIELCEDLPDIASEADSLGALYVTEGSTLGGRHITRMISRQLNLPPDKGFTFFNAYGDQTDLMWQQFKILLNQHRNADEQSSMMESATNTFLKFNDWVSVYEQADNEQV